MRHTQPFCKVDFTKIRFFAFFLITIRIISQKCIIFAPDFNYFSIANDGL